jgi:pimeloyl-ACP methyl ester carboxylesterase
VDAHVLTAMVIAAGTFGPRFRIYTIGTIILAFGFGAWALSESPRINQGLPTPWVGVKERIFWYGYQSWSIALALAMLRGRTKEESISRSPFKTTRGKAAYLAAYEAAMKLWPVPYEEMDIPSPFGTTHVVVSGARGAPPLVLLHGAMATLTMWVPNVIDFVKDFRVYAIDTMGHPSKSVPDKPIKDATDYVAWLTNTLDQLHLDRVSLVGMSHGGWLALNFAVAKPERVEKLALLSPGGFLPWAKQWILRVLLMALFPTRLTVYSFLRWAGLSDRQGLDASPIMELTYLGLKHFRIPQETQRIRATVLSDLELQRLYVPVLLLFVEHEVMHDAKEALARARKHIRNLQGDLVPNCRHDMCLNQHRLVDARVVDFLRTTRIGDPDRTRRHSMA